MKEKIIRIFWGVLLISLGGLSLADKLGYVNMDMITSQVWGIIFAAISAAFFLSYFLSGVRNWGWLFPALIFAALALTIRSILGNPDSPIVAMPILLSIGIPFYAGYLLNRKHLGLLIPAWILTVVAFIPALTERVDSNLIGTLFLYATALPFLIVYLVNRQRKWALITGVIVGIIGTLPLLDYLNNEDIMGSIVMFLFTLGFLVVYFVAKKNWWAIIPAGVFASIGLVALLGNLLPNQAYTYIGNYQIGIYSSVLFLGFAITFIVLWMLRTTHPTSWAKYPAIGLLIIALVAFLMGKGFENLLLAVIPLVIGVIIIAGAFKRKKITNQVDS